ncbi:MAG: hypothetical protein RBT74_03680 [Tenuifilaceae bacterium]|nr:hypothetical protein [Tenuifilaceae bacterium]
MRILATLIAVMLCSSLSKAIDGQLEVNSEFYTQVQFGNPLFQSISSAVIVKAGVAYTLPQANLPLIESEKLFLVTGNSATPFNSEYELLTSPQFVASIQSNYRLQSNADAEAFHNLFSLIDMRWSRTSFYQQGNSWYFIRNTFFDDVEFWRIDTDDSGKVQTIAYESRMEITIPDQVVEPDDRSPLLDKQTDIPIAPPQLDLIKENINSSISFSQSVNKFTDYTISQISNAIICEHNFNIEEVYTDSEGNSYNSTRASLVINVNHNGDVRFFESHTDVITSSIFLGSISPKFTLKTDEDAQLFEKMLDEITPFYEPKKERLQKDNAWFFIRDESFGDNEGFAVTIDSNGRVQRITHSRELGVEGPVVEIDENTVEWNFRLLQPETTNLEISEGTPIEFAFEFNAEAANQLGVWVMSQVNGDMMDMVYGGLSSPFYGHIPAHLLTQGTHTLGVYLMRPGNDTETAYGKAIVNITVKPFDDNGIEWGIKLEEPKTTSLKVSEGQSVPVAIAYNAQEANRVGLRLEVRHNGELAVSQTPPTHKSPYTIDIPSGVLTKGSHKVEFVFMGGTKIVKTIELNIEVE